MNNVSLVLYIIRVRDLEKNHQYFNLDNIKGKSFIDILNSYYKDRQSISCNSYENKAISVKLLNKNGSKFNGQVEVGSYGYSSKIRSIYTSKITHEKTDKEVEMIPLFFGGIIPQNAYKGLIALEKFKTFGCKTILQDDLNRYLADIDINARITLHPILPEKVAKQYLQRGNVCKVRLVKHTAPNDIADIYKDEFKNGEFGEFEYVINPKRNNYLPFKPNINKFLNNEITLKQVIEIQGFEYDNMKVEIGIGSKKRTISLNNLDKLTGDIDISNEVEFNEDGHPNFKSILSISNEVINEYIDVIDYSNYDIRNIVEKENEEILDGRSAIAHQ